MEEVVVLAVGNPSSLLSPEKTYKEVPETRSQGWSVQQGCNHMFLYVYVHVANDSDSTRLQIFAVVADYFKQNSLCGMWHADLIVQGRVWRNIVKGIYMGLRLLHSAHLHSCKHTKPKTHLSHYGPMHIADPQSALFLQNNNKTRNKLLTQDRF